ncbi:MAG: C40 family peptidase [Acidimicrobiales bacterium]
MRKHHSRHRVARFLLGAAGFAAGTVTLSFSGTTPVVADQAPSYWMAHSGGHVDAVGGAQSLGSDTPDSGAYVAAIVPTPDGSGYWLAESGGRVTAFGDATGYGSPQGITHPVVGMAATADGKGYWLVASDGGVFSYGDAGFYGSTGAEHLASPVIAIAPTSDGRGYWLVASDGGVFTFGDAGFFGSAGAKKLSAPVTGITPTADGRGYWLYAADGGVFNYGDATFLGSGAPAGSGTPVDQLVAADDSNGYWLVDGAGEVRAFGSDGSTPPGVFTAMAEASLPPVYSSSAASGPAPAPSPAPPSLTQRAEKFALSQQGKPYSYGASGLGAYDCSGLVYRAFEEQGVTLPRTAAGQYDAGSHLPLSQAAPGDLVFWSSGGSIYHVGIYVGDGDVVNATHTGSTVQVMAIGEIGSAVPEVTRITG